MLSWFDAKNAQQFGATLADFYIERVPAAEAGEPGKKTEKKAEKHADRKKQDALQKMLAQAEIFKINNKLNLYKKAKLGNAFKWKLLDAGYAAELADELTRIILVNM